MLIGSNGKPLADMVRDMKSYTSTKLKKSNSQFAGKQAGMDSLDDGTAGKEKRN